MLFRSECESVVVNCETGKAEYKGNFKTKDEFLKCQMASCSVPFICEPVEIDVTQSILSIKKETALAVSFFACAPLFKHRDVYKRQEYAGALPTWMAPEQVRFLPVTDRANEYCEKVAAQLEEQGFRTEVDYRNEKIGRKIRDAQTEKVPYMVIVGDRDMENGTVSPRHRADGDLGAMSVDEFSALLKRVVDNKEQK